MSEKNKDADSATKISTKKSSRLKSATNKKTSKTSIPGPVLEAKELILAAVHKLQVLPGDYRQVAWLLEDILEELDGVHDESLPNKNQKHQKVLKDLEQYLANEGNS